MIKEPKTFKTNKNILVRGMSRFQNLATKYTYHSYIISFIHGNVLAYCKFSFIYKKNYISKIFYLIFEIL